MHRGFKQWGRSEPDRSVLEPILDLEDEEGVGLLLRLSDRVGWARLGKALLGEELLGMAERGLVREYGWLPDRPREQERLRNKGRERRGRLHSVGGPKLP